MAVEQVFKALADPHRRHLLDALAQADGQTLAQLCASLPMTRFGVSKHLDILEEAGLITTRKEGRTKRHYLNPAPIQDVARWVEPYRRLWNDRLDRLEAFLQDQQLKEQPRDDNEP